MKCKIYLNPYSAGIDFRRQNLTTLDVYFRRRQILASKVDPRTVKVILFLVAVDPQRMY